MQSGSKYLRNGPVLSLKTESAISQLQVRLFLQSLLQAFSAYIFHSADDTCLDIHLWFIVLPMVHGK